MDRRQQKTRKAIFEAFLALLERKNFGAITVREIIEEANVGRSTFYAHFETKDDLLKAMSENIFQHVFSKDLTQESNHDFSHAGHDFKKELTHILYHLQENKKNLKGLLACESGAIFIKYFKDYLFKVFSEHIQAYPTAPMEYALHHAVCSFTETVRWWITECDFYTPEQITAFFMEAVSLKT